jgi:hypothetical protein
MCGKELTSPMAQLQVAELVLPESVAENENAVTNKQPSPQFFLSFFKDHHVLPRNFLLSISISFLGPESIINSLWTLSNRLSGAARSRTGSVHQIPVMTAPPRGKTARIPTFAGGTKKLTMTLLY